MLNFNRDLTGSVFVVTKGAGSYKLGLVKIYFLKEPDYNGTLGPIASQFSAEYKAKYAECKAAQDRFNTDLASARQVLTELHAALDKVKDDGKTVGQITDTIDNAAQQLEAAEASQGHQIQIFDTNANTSDKLAALKKYLIDTAKTQADIDAADKLDEGPKKVFDQSKIDMAATTEIAHKVPPAREELLAAQDALKADLVALSNIKNQYLPQLLNGAGKSSRIAVTDADGLYKIALPSRDKYILFAAATRTVGADEESYDWIVPFSFDSNNPGTLNLTNDNELFGSDGSGSSVVNLGVDQTEKWTSDIPTESDLVHIVL